MAGTATRLFRNLGANGDRVQFEDVTVSSGLALKTGAGLGVVFGDFDGDHWPDIFVADDGSPNRLYLNQRNGTFREEAIQRGLAFNALGSAAANMGVAVGDVDGNGFPDLFIPHVSWEQHGLWMQGPAGLFLERAAEAGLTGPRLRGTGFGTALVDFDLDGDLDLAIANGRIRRDALMPPFQSGLDAFWQPYAQPSQVFANDGTGKFREISPINSGLGAVASVSRGLAYGDLDYDGLVDLLVMNTGAPARLWRNTVFPHGHWLTVRAVEPALGGRDAYGAEVSVVVANQRWRRWIQPGSSYLVSNDPRAHIGLGAAARVDRIEVQWPNGDAENFAGVEADRTITLRHGAGIKP
jgi:hypothetical protein